MVSELAFRLAHQGVDGNGVADLDRRCGFVFDSLGFPDLAIAAFLRFGHVRKLPCWRLNGQGPLHAMQRDDGNGVAANLSNGADAQPQGRFAHIRHSRTAHHDKPLAVDNRLWASRHRAMRPPLASRGACCIPQPRKALFRNVAINLPLAHSLRSLASIRENTPTLSHATVRSLSSQGKAKTPEPRKQDKAELPGARGLKPSHQTPSLKPLGGVDTFRNATVAL